VVFLAGLMVKSLLRPDDRQCKFWGIELHFDQLQHSRCEKQFIKIRLKSFVQISATFPLSAIIVYSNNTIRTDQWEGSGRTQAMHESLREILDLAMQKDANLRLSGLKSEEAENASK